ncbi:MAG: twin-arginine translocase subunit TatB [Halomonadaceae bacterium]|nr:twin-arginine translocase subunit TatB [Halomonadaceae bacterium]
MFDIGFLELLIIGVVGLLVLGPERLPRAARTTGLWIGKIKRTVSGMQRDISAQLEAEELRQKLNEQQKKLDASLNKAKQDVERYAEPDRVDAGHASPGNAHDNRQESPQENAPPASATGQQTNDRAQGHDEATAAAEAPREASADSDKDQSPR